MEFEKLQLMIEHHQQENAGSHKKMVPHVQGQRISPSKTGRSEIEFRTKPDSYQRHLEGSNKTLRAPGPRDPRRD